MKFEENSIKLTCNHFLVPSTGYLNSNGNAVCRLFPSFSREDRVDQNHSLSHCLLFQVFLLNFFTSYNSWATCELLIGQLPCSDGRAARWANPILFVRLPSSGFRSLDCHTRVVTTTILTWPVPNCMCSFSTRQPHRLAATLLMIRTVLIIKFNHKHLIAFV